MNSKLLCSCFAGLVFALPADAALIAHWNFNDLNISGNRPPGTTSAPLSVEASQGVATLDLSGWAGNIGNNLGSSINGLDAEADGNDLAFVGQGGNASHVDLQFSMAGHQGLVVTFAARRSGTGFNVGTWSYSTGGDFYDMEGASTFASNFSLVTVDFSGIPELNGASSAILRLTLDGATSSSGNVRIDNLQLNAVQLIPEPSSALLAVFGLVPLLRRRR